MTVVLRDDYNSMFYGTREILTGFLLVFSLFFATYSLVYIKYKKRRMDDFYEIETKERELKHLEKKLSQINSLLEQ